VPGPQVTALRILLGEPALRPPGPSQPAPLVAAILASRRGQAELSAALGERVRLAVELLIRESSAVLSAIDGDGSGGVSRRDIYIAAIRLIMRCVVILFAEARDLLPRDHVIYHQCYGVQGLREQLARLAGGRSERLRHAHGAWPRLLSLFRLIDQGSTHESLPIPRYGGGLFVPGDPGSQDPVLRALAAFEDTRNAPTDAAIHDILELLCVSQVKVRQGRASTWVPAPVDFSDLSSEYIGILYEGLLDFELHRAPEDDAVVFLRLGDEPALPLSRLEEEMAPGRLAELIGKLKKSTKTLAEAEEQGEEEAEEEGGEEEETGEVEGGPEETTADDAVAVGSEALDGDIARVVRERAEIWAEKAIKEARLVPYPRPDVDPLVRERWNQEVKRKARALYRLVLPGQWYVVRWGGTRKGAGTFYTRPQLAVPTTRRALQPLCYEPAEQVTDQATGLTTVTKWVPRRPEDILALKVCDPAMGSGSFLVAALRYLTDALVESLHFHGRLHPRPDGAICKLADGLPLDHPSQETVPVPLDHPEFNDRLRARLKRHVVERCIYGVDIDPLAVELARMALWVETMDRRLPFGFLDHKLRCGNALVGCWFDRFQDYPVMAFERDDAGDKNHDRFVHHFRVYTVQRGQKKGETRRAGDVWTQRWKEVRENVVKPEMRSWIEARGPQNLLFPLEGYTPQAIHDQALAVFRELHDLPVHEADRREQLYREKIAGNPALARLREVFDTWCAIWFWPGDEIDLVPTPRNFQDPPDVTRDGWGIRYAREFDMTNDSKLFPPRPWWEERGYRPNEYGIWVGPKGDVALPLYEGRMIGQFDFSQKGWVRGKGRGAVWREIPWNGKMLEPQFLMRLQDARYGLGEQFETFKVAFMDVGSGTNARTMIATALARFPCSHKVPVLGVGQAPIMETLAAVALLNSFVYDTSLRLRLGGLSITWHYLEETALPRRLAVPISRLASTAASLSLPTLIFTPEWIGLASSSHESDLRARPWKCLWALTDHERLRLRCILDAVVAHLYGLDADDLAWILRDCDHPVEALRPDDFTRALDPKGFWRVDKDRDPELRHTVLTLVAFHELKRLGLEAFLAQNDGEGWMLPETLRLADYGLGHDERAKEPQPVASRLGPRFLPWQLEQTPRESWEECARHAERLEALLGRVPTQPAEPKADGPGKDKIPTDLFGQSLPTDLFGNAVTPKSNRRKR
jgi:hypothetical protein